MKTITPKAYIIIILCIVIFVLLCTAALNYLVDPLMLYHEPWFGLKPVLTNQRYQTAGCIKHLNYDNIIMGNSMCENFEADWFEYAFSGKTIKLPISGSIACNWADVLAVLKDYHPKYVLANMDYDILSMTPERAHYQLPEYLYDQDPLNDINYLLNLEILAEQTIPFLVSNARGNTTDLNRVYEWEANVPNSRETVLQIYYKTDLSKEITYTPEQAIRQTQANLGLLEPYWQIMSDTEFVYFFSPRSMLYWYMLDLCGELESVHQAYAEGISIMNSYPNVTVFFWDDELIRSITADLNKYSDPMHYGKAVSQLLAQRIENREGIVTSETAKYTVDTFFEYITSFSYDTLF